MSKKTHRDRKEIAIRSLPDATLVLLTLIYSAVHATARVIDKSCVTQLMIELRVKVCEINTRAGNFCCVHIVMMPPSPLAAICHIYGICKCNSPKRQPNHDGTSTVGSEPSGLADRAQQS